MSKFKKRYLCILFFALVCCGWIVCGTKKFTHAQTTASKPDLAVTDINFLTDFSLVKDENGTLAVTIQNLGGDLTNSAGLTNSYNNFSDQNFIFAAQTPNALSFIASRDLPTENNPLKTNEKITFSWLGKFNTAGNIYLHFTVDNADELQETNEQNNTFTKMMVIKDTVVPPSKVLIACLGASPLRFQIQWDWDIVSSEYEIGIARSIKKRETGVTIHINKATEHDYIDDDKTLSKEPSIYYYSLYVIKNGARVSDDIQYEVINCANSAVIKCSDSDNSPAYNVYARNPVNASNPDIYQKGMGKGIYEGPVGNFIIGLSENMQPASDNFSTFYDYCRDEIYLAEAFCSANGKLSGYEIKCPNGCKDGVCIKKTDTSIEKINNAAKNLNDNKFDQILEEIKVLKDVIKEQQAQIKYLTKLTQGIQKLSEKVENVINNFITYGVDENTQKLGAGERAAVMYSYKAAFEKLPETEEELSDAIKIANGRWPSATNQNAENKAKEQFQKIYKRTPDTNNVQDNAAATIMAYGLRQRAENRNLESEKKGIEIFKSIYNKLPETTEEWNTMQAITYSGATR